MLQPRRFASCGAAALIALGAIAARDPSASAGQHTSSAAATRDHEGYTARLDTDWPQTGGYRPLLLKLTPTKSVPFDRTIRVEIRMESRGYNYNRRGDVLVYQDIFIPKGTSGGQPLQAALTVPCVALQGQLRLRFFEIAAGGGPVEIERMAIQDWSQLDGWDNVSSVLLVEAKSGMSGTKVQYGVTPFGNAVCNFYHLDPAACPANWLHYTSFDVVMLSLADLTTLVKTNPAAWDAMKRWVASGGNLWIHNVAPMGGWAGIAKLDELIGAPPGETPGEGGRGAIDPALRGWQACPRGEQVDLQASYWGGPMAIRTPAGGTTPTPLPDTKPATPSLDFAVRRSYGLGQIVAIGPSSHPASAGQTVAEVFQSAGHERTIWSLRHGHSPGAASDEFWDFLVPGVGRNPVWWFLGLITVFAVVIGPVNYVMLRRKRRLHLLVVSVPGLAAVATIGLFGYAIITDGLSVRVRARTFTRIDQKRDEAVCWSRLSYYAGMAPSGGLKFPSDLAVAEIVAFDDSRSQRRQELWWTPDRQWLASGWVRSRESAQLLTLRSRKTRFELEIAERAGQPPVVKNLLGTNVRRLLLCDSAGKMFWLYDLPPGESAMLKDDGYDTEAGRLADAIAAAKPANPDGLDASTLRGATWGWWGRRSQASLDENLMEKAIAQLLEDLRARKPLGKRSYVAIVDRSPEADYGVGSFSEVSSLHVIVGEW
jgi:hypothetical protein